MTAVLPVIGSKGFFNLLPPFDTATLNKVEYTCQAIRRISDYVANNEDPKTDIYTANNISEDIYKEDLANDAYIVSLQSRSGHWLYVPYRFIQSYPSANGIGYVAKMIGVSIPPVPIDQDLSNVVSTLTDVASSLLGVNVATRVVEISKVSYVTQDIHVTKQTERAIAAAGTHTLYAQVQSLTSENSVLRAKVAELENYIKSI